jgi:hypothetical protein
MEQFRVYRGTDNYYLSGAGNSYTLWSPLPSDFPSGRPPVYVYLPNPLWGFRGIRTINSYGLSHAMHTLANGPNNEVQICHWRSDKWHGGITLNKVMLKAIIWLEAYEQHIITGSDIDSFVRTMM